jgi:hypothetical protein
MDMGKSARRNGNGSGVRYVLVYFGFLIIYAFPGPLVDVCFHGHPNKLRGNEAAGCFTQG